jgi:ribonucleotide monophosphatase NagD (HAD superfamily)
MDHICKVFFQNCTRNWHIRFLILLNSAKRTGVLHNGVTALEGAVDCLEQLYRANKKLIILSNTSAPSEKALQKLPKFGFNPQHITTGAVTSGEEAARYILKQYGSSDVTKKALMMTWDASDPNNPRLTALPEQFLDVCGNIAVANSVEDADFLLLHGSEVWYRGSGNDHKCEPVSLAPFITEGSFDTVDPILKQCVKQKLPMVCANPDNIVRKPDGGEAHMPGKLASRYLELLMEEKESIVVDCRVFGKPHAEHFQACLNKLKTEHGIEAHRVAHVGDSLHHDIVGASKAGIASVWTASSGIHANSLQLNFGDLPTIEQVQDLLDKEDVPAPTHIVPAFLW